LQKTTTSQLLSSSSALGNLILIQQIEKVF